MTNFEYHYENTNLQAPGSDITIPDNLRCGWENKSQGRCSGEVDFIVTFQPPPCGHEQSVGLIARLCGRHMLRAMFVLMTTRYCEVCGSKYQGIGLLKHLDRL